MGRVIHFEIHAENPERAIAFYRELFGWEFTKWAGPLEYWLIVTGPADKPGINGGLMKRHGPAPSPGQPVNAFGCTIEVDNLDAALAKSEVLKGKVALPKMPVPGVGWLAYIVDTEGNILGMMQPDPSAS